MGRLIKWLVGLVVIIGLIYIGLVAVTGSKVRDITEQQLQAYNAQSPDADIEISWHEAGFWRSEGDIRMTMPIENESLELVHSITLKHGALRAKVQGEVTGNLAGTSFNEMLFNNQTVNLDGRVGLAGVRLTYAVPELLYVDEELDISYAVAPFEFDLVLQEQAQHSQLHIDWVQFDMFVEGSSHRMRWEDIETTGQSRLNADDSQFEHAEAVFSVGEMVFGATDETIAHIENLRNETDVARTAGVVEVENRLTVEAYEISGVTGDLTFNMTLSPISFASFQALQSGIDDIQSTNALLHDLQQNNASMVIEKLELTMGQMGNLNAHGEFQLRDDIDFQQGFSAESAWDLLQGELEINDLPILLLMPLSGMVSGELPWTLELREGDLLINGETLNLP